MLCYIRYVTEWVHGDHHGVNDPDEDYDHDDHNDDDNDEDDHDHGHRKRREEDNHDYHEEEEGEGHGDHATNHLHLNAATSEVYIRYIICFYFTLQTIFTIG